jgi:hypothetical protein
VLLIVLVLVALAVAGILLGSVIGDDLFGEDDPGGAGQSGGPPPEDVEDALAVSASSFDPEGDDDERGDLVGAAVDGDPATTWRTETYRTADFSGLGKTGVGLVLTLDQPGAVGELVVSSPTDGWSAEVYVAGAAGDSLDAWGDPVSEQSAMGAGDVAFDLGGADGGAVLLWITELGQTDGEFRVEIAEAAVVPA